MLFDCITLLLLRREKYRSIQGDRKVVLYFYNFIYIINDSELRLNNSDWIDKKCFYFFYIYRVKSSKIDNILPDSKAKKYNFFYFMIEVQMLIVTEI